jgi:hypothetical protein
MPDNIILTRVGGSVPGYGSLGPRSAYWPMERDYGVSHDRGQVSVGLRIVITLRKLQRESITSQLSGSLEGRLIMPFSTWECETPTRLLPTSLAT